MSFPLIKYVLKAAVRDRLIIALLLLMIVTTSLSIFMGSSAIVEKNDFTIVFTSGGLRMAGAIGLILFTVFFIRRSFEARDIEYLLSRPISRVQFLLSYAAGLSVLAVLTAVVQWLSLAFVMNFQITEGVMLWGFSLLIENIIIVNASLFFAMFLSSAASASMAVLGFYVLSRMMGQILGILKTGGKSQLFEGLEYVMQMVSMVMPRIDLMGQSSWLLYGTGDQIGYGFLLLQGIFFTGLILSATLIDLTRRQF